LMTMLDHTARVIAFAFPGHSLTSTASNHTAER
jgi:hypothetical protein